MHEFNVAIIEECYIEPGTILLRTAKVVRALSFKEDPSFKLVSRHRNPLVRLIVWRPNKKPAASELAPHNPFGLRPTLISPDDGLTISVGFGDHASLTDGLGHRWMNHLGVII